MQKMKMAICLLVFCNIAMIGILLLTNSSRRVDISVGNVMNQPKPIRIDNKEEERKQIALTFDDGPHPQYTPKLLEGLKIRDVKATFFVTGQNVALYPEIIKEIDNNGHLIGNHTYTHLELRADNLEEFLDELYKTNEIIKEVIGKNTEYVRPPFGRWSEVVEEKIMMFPIFWTIDPLDWCTEDVGKVIQRVVPKVEEQDIILLHDCYSTTVEATLQIVDILLEQGYEFVTVDKIVLK